MAEAVGASRGAANGWNERHVAVTGQPRNKEPWKKKGRVEEDKRKKKSKERKK